LKQVASIDDDRRSIVGVTSIDTRFFVLRAPSQQKIQVYDLQSFQQQQQQQTIKLIGFSNDASCSGLTSCVTNNCLYVSDWCKNAVYKVELTANNEVSKWSVGRWPRGLSINAACNLIVACYYKIQEYNTTSGSLVREISLKSNGVELNPFHAIQLTSDQFVVSCCYNDDENDVVEINTKRLQVVVSYTNQLKSTTQHKFNWPRQLSVDKNNESILAADIHNNRIVILNRSLKCCTRELNVMMLVDGGLREPSCLYFNVSQNRLFVGEWSGQCRLLVFENVI
jgi:hypothetical protein